MAKEKDKIFAVIGLGVFGLKVCEVIAERGGRVIAIDKDPSLIEKIKDIVTQSILLDSTDETAMNQIPYADISVAIVAIGEHIEASILTTAILKRLGIPYIVARAVTEIHHQVLRQVGADEVVNIEIEEGQRIAQRLISPEVLDRISVTENISVAEVYVPKDFLGKTLAKLNIRNKMHVNIVAILRTTLSVDEEGNPVKTDNAVFPDAAEILQESDIMLIVGKNEDLDAFRKL
ncbi:MAG: TrkA family potassium uptake protein [Spirochaetaceae bacterium]|nr:TrkA family potassium uptake protein [Spirochaetaceae bacterium]